MRTPAALAFLLLPGAALAWPACDQAGIQPPVAIAREAPAYPPAVRALGIEGSVEIALTVLRDGRVGWTQVLRADPPGYFEQAASSGVRRWRFEPARRNGEPVECRMLTRVRFTLADTADPPAARTDAAIRPSPACRDARPMAATALLTDFFDPGHTHCPGSQVPDPKRPAAGKPRPRVTQNDERPAGRAGP